MTSQKLHEIFSQESIPQPDQLQFLIFQYSNLSPEITRSIFQSLWQHPDLNGGYRIDQLGCDRSQRQLLNTNQAQPDTLYGIATLPDGSTAGCRSHLSRSSQDASSKTICQIEFGICLDSLLPYLQNQSYHLSFNSHQHLSKRLDHWLTSIANLIYQQHPFLLAIIPHSPIWSSCDAIARHGIPDYDHNGYILPENGELIWYPPQWPQTIEPTGYFNIIKRAEAVERSYEDELGVGFFMELPDGISRKKAISLCKYLWTHPNLIGPTPNSLIITEPHKQKLSDFTDYENQDTSLEYCAGNGVAKLPSGVLSPCNVTIYGFDDDFEDVDTGMVVGVELKPITVFKPDYIHPQRDYVSYYYPDWEEKIFKEYDRQWVELQLFLSAWVISLAKHCYKHTPFLSAHLNNPNRISESGLSFWAGKGNPQDDPFSADLLTLMPKDEIFLVYAPLKNSSCSPREVSLIDRSIRESIPL